MNITPQQVTVFLASLTVIGQIVIVLSLAALFLRRFSSTKRIASGPLQFASRYSLQLAFIVALTAMVGSLYFSDIAGYTPCLLCWWQRILMYPQVLLLGMAMVRKELTIIPYSLLMVSLGTILSAIHYYQQITYNPLIPCSTVGISVSCTERSFTTFGYITIPLMACTAFVMIAVFLILARKKPALDNA